MAVNPFIGTSAFDPEMTATLALAFETAWATVARSGSPLATPENADATREELAKNIIAAAHDGERDLQRLVERALSHLAERRTPVAKIDKPSP